MPQPQPLPPGTESASFAVGAVADLYETDNMQLACVLATLDVPYEKKSSSIVRVTGDRIADPGGRLIWSFAPRSRDGSVVTAEIVARWNDVDWMSKAAETPPTADPSTIAAHVFAALRFYGINERAMVKQVKESREFFHVRHGKYRVWIDKAAPQAVQDLYLQRAGL